MTTISEYMRRRTEEFFGITKHIEVIHNFVNCSIYRPNPEARARIEADHSHFKFPACEAHPRLHTRIS